MSGRFKSDDPESWDCIVPVALEVVTTGYETWLPVVDAARRLGVTPERVRQLCNAGKLTHARLATGRLIDPAAVDARLATTRPASPPELTPADPPRRDRTRTGRRRAP